MAKYIFSKKGLKKVDEIEELGKRICRFAECYEKGKGRIPELAALADVLFCIKEIFKNYNKKFERLEERPKDKGRIKEQGSLEEEDERSCLLSVKEG